MHYTLDDTHTHTSTCTHAACMCRAFLDRQTWSVRKEGIPWPARPFQSCTCAPHMRQSARKDSDSLITHTRKTFLFALQLCPSNLQSPSLSLQGAAVKSPARSRARLVSGCFFCPAADATFLLSSLSFRGATTFGPARAHPSASEGWLCKRACDCVRVDQARKHCVCAAPHRRAQTHALRSHSIELLNQSRLFARTRALHLSPKARMEIWFGSLDRQLQLDQW